MELRRTLEINEKDPLEIFVDGKEIILRKFVSNTDCIVTGEITPDNFTSFNHITLSPKGAEVLLTHLKSVFVNIVVASIYLTFLSKSKSVQL